LQSDYKENGLEQIQVQNGGKDAMLFLFLDNFVGPSKESMLFSKSSLSTFYTAHVEVLSDEWSLETQVRRFQVLATPMRRMQTRCKNLVKVIAKVIKDEGKVQGTSFHFLSVNDFF
jgi:hypothetical protein